MAADPPTSRFFLALMLVAIALLAMVTYPVASELFLAAVLAGVLWPLQQRLTRHLRGRPGVAAGVVVSLVVLVLVGPLAALAAFMIRDSDDALAWVAKTASSDYVQTLLARLPETLRDFLVDAIARLPATVGDALLRIGADRGTAAAAAGASAALSTTLMLIGLYFLLVRGDQLVGWLDEVSPLRPGQTKELLLAFKSVSYAVVVSTFVTSGVQALAALIGYLIARVPNPAFFAAVTFFVAFIPAIGAGAVCVVAALLLFVTGHPYLAIFLALWGIVVVGLADNVVRPLLIKRGLEMHGAVVFFSLIGGLAAFGSIGLLVGPLAVAFFLALVRMYRQEASPPSLPGGVEPTTGDG